MQWLLATGPGDDHEAKARPGPRQAVIAWGLAMARRTYRRSRSYPRARSRTRARLVMRGRLRARMTQILNTQKKSLRVVG